jgi:AraC-like DNA-binding protein
MNGLDFSKLTVTDIELVTLAQGKAGAVLPLVDPTNFQLRLPRKQHGLVLVQKGKGRYVFQNQLVLETNPGTLLYLPKGWKYYVETLEDTECVCVNFSLLEDVSPEPWIYRPKNFTQWEEMFDRLLRLWKYPALGYKARCKAVLYEMLATIEEDQQIKYLPKGKKERIENAILRMEEEFQKGNNVDIPFLAEQCDMSQTYFRRLFHSLYGVSPKQYILSARMRWAKNMLKGTDDSIAEIAKNCGYDSVYYFSRAFRIHEGVSPSEYRNSHKEL